MKGTTYPMSIESLLKDVKPKILFFDIETSPNLAWVWGKYEQDVIDFNREWYILSFCAKWAGGTTIVRGLPDYKIYAKNSQDDGEIVAELWELFNEADVIVGHNGDNFDIKKTNARFVEHGFKPPKPYKTIDTLKIARKYFKFNSNSLSDLGKKLGVGEKLKTGGFDLWLKCMNKDPQAWKKLKRYNKQDVLLLEKIYLKFRPWMTNHPNLAILSRKVDACPVCASGRLRRRGYGANRTGVYQRYVCLDCGAWSSGRSRKFTDVR